MDAQLLIPVFFMFMAVVFAGLATSGRLGLRDASRPAQLAHWRIAGIFGLVSVFLFVYL